MEHQFSNLLMDECPPDLRSPEDDSSPTGPHKSLSPPPSDSNKLISKGVAMSFGFKRRMPPSIASNATAARRLANVDGNGNNAVTTTDLNEDTDRLMNNVAATGRSTPRLAPPKKEANGATRVSRFGFRQAQGYRQNKVADLNYPPMPPPQSGNNNIVVKRPLPTTRTTSSAGNDNNNRNRVLKVGAPPQIAKFTLQSTQLPRPEPIRLIETKSAKTLANNNKRAGMHQHHPEETSSKDGSLTEDSGVGSHLSGYIGENETGLEQMEGSPTFGVRRRSLQYKPRNLEVVVTSKTTFDVRDLDDSNDSCDSIPPPPLPQLPSAFNSSSDNRKKSYQSIGLVRERTIEYQRHLHWDNHRKISVTSSEGFSDDYGEEEKTYRDIFRSEKTFVKSTPPHQAFLKSRTNELKGDSSPPSSDEHDWGHGGEAMADELSFSLSGLSSSDESKDKHQDDSVPISTAVIGSALQSLMSSSLSKAFTSTASTEVKNVMLTIEDPKFAAVAAASTTGALLDDETLISPVDSISCSETEEIKRKFQRSSSDSKDINEKPTPPTPGTPTNASNSLSLSDGKDDFLIDDEIADQPALVFEDRVTATDNNVSQNNSETTPTIVDSTPKPKRKVPMAFEGSPLSIRSRKFLHSRTGSLDTLSPCESIASDDLMMDYEYSQSSGLEECDRQSSGFPSLNDTTLQPKNDRSESIRELKDWNLLVGNYVTSEKPSKSHTSRPRLLRSRAGTPNSVPDSPRSLDSRATRISRPTPGSPAKSRLAISQISTGYDSDDSIRLDRANHTAMKQDIMSIKTMLLKLRRVLNETEEDMLMRSETHNPFENQAVLTNGIFNSLCPSDFDNAQGEDNEEKARLELAEMRRQVLFLQGQLEDKEKTVLSLQEQMIKLANDNYHANSAPASTVATESQMCNAATQTERLRPISAGPSLLNGSAVDGSALVSATETPSTRRSRPLIQADASTASKRTPAKLWRQPGEPPSPQRYTSSSIPRRANSRTRTSASTS